MRPLAGGLESGPAITFLLNDSLTMGSYAPDWEWPMLCKEHRSFCLLSHTRQADVVVMVVGTSWQRLQARGRCMSSWAPPD
jgi:hypothetical protein